MASTLHQQSATEDRFHDETVSTDNPAQHRHDSKHDETRDADINSTSYVSLHGSHPTKSSRVKRSTLLSTNRMISHHPKAGINPLVDATASVFFLLGELKPHHLVQPLSRLHNELIQELTQSQETAKLHGYSAEYLMVYRYILCATIDDIIMNTSWGGQGQWETYSVLATFNLDRDHQNKFFSIVERAIKEPALYIDLMELIYLCISLGYKGQYRETLHNQYQLEQITHNLYKRIRSYRGNVSKSLLPLPIKPLSHKTMSQKNKTSIPFIFCLAGCMIMTLFISLSYLMDTNSNEAYQQVTQLENPN